MFHLSFHSLYFRLGKSIDLALNVLGPFHGCVESSDGPTEVVLHLTVFSISNISTVLFLSFSFLRWYSLSSHAFLFYFCTGVFNILILF